MIVFYWRTVSSHLHKLKYSTKFTSKLNELKIHLVSEPSTGLFWLLNSSPSRSSRYGKLAVMVCFLEWVFLTVFVVLFVGMVDLDRIDFRSCECDVLCGLIEIHEVGGINERLWFWWVSSAKFIVLKFGFLCLKQVWCVILKTFLSDFLNLNFCVQFQFLCVASAAICVCSFSSNPSPKGFQSCSPHPLSWAHTQQPWLLLDHAGNDTPIINMRDYHLLELWRPSWEPFLSPSIP